MKFGPVKVADALGAVLAHSVGLGGRERLRKGAVLDDDALSRLEGAGVAEVIVAQLEPGDVAEDAAAARLAAALAEGSDGLRLGPAATGRVNIHAEGRGVALIDAEAIRRVNAVDPMITVATLPQFLRLDPGAMLATVKIIAYAVPEDRLEAAEAAGRGALTTKAPVCRTATLIQTVQSAGDRPKGRAALEARLSRFGATLLDEVRVENAAAPLAEALQAAQGDILFILTATATSDLRDTGPAALRAAGGTVEHFGMPVDPGNLLFFGYLEGRPVVGLPGCARSPAMNGADWVMERLICGVPVTSADISAMGVGGLLKEVQARGRPRDAKVH